MDHHNFKCPKPSRCYRDVDGADIHPDGEGYYVIYPNGELLYFYEPTAKDETCINWNWDIDKEQDLDWKDW
jgi:hypothetical protein